MKTIVCVFAFACSVLLSGCSGERQAQEPPGIEKKPPPMVQIQNLTITDANLILDYRVSNPFDDDIRVCYDTWAYPNQAAQDAATRIEGETVWIKLRSDLDRGPDIVIVDPPAVAKYVRLLPGESCSGRIHLNLPIKDRDYLREFFADRKKHEEIVLHRAVFEVGYFGPKWNMVFDSSHEMLKKKSIKPKPMIMGPNYYLTFDPLITEETLDGRLREVMYMTGRPHQQSVEVLIADVNIPCSVIVDDK